ncbi:MAG: multiheme c-type cytochrome [Candidatus Methylomirabilis sp.]|nr:multiheme c-type cytochrome [Candidatus Methylomirabilis sp.]
MSYRDQERRQTLLPIFAIVVAIMIAPWWNPAGAAESPYLPHGAGAYRDQWLAPSVFQWLDPNLFTPRNPIQGVFQGEACVACHTGITPTIVNDWKVSKHAPAKVSCTACHGNDHQKLSMPKPETCEGCHKTQVTQYREELKAGHPAHARAMDPDVYENAWQMHKPPAEVVGCAQCHRIGSVGCDSCHTRHKFSAAEARKPSACMSCHSGVDHRDYEVWENAKHGNIWHAEQQETDWTKPLARGNYRFPTCAYCHMPGATTIRYAIPSMPPWGCRRSIAGRRNIRQNGIDGSGCAAIATLPDSHGRSLSTWMKRSASAFRRCGRPNRFSKTCIRRASWNRCPRSWPRAGRAGMRRASAA